MSLGCDHDIESGPPGFPSEYNEWDTIICSAPGTPSGNGALTHKNAASLHTTRGLGRRIPWRVAGASRLEPARVLLSQAGQRRIASAGRVIPISLLTQSDCAFLGGWPIECGLGCPRILHSVHSGSSTESYFYVSTGDRCCIDAIER